MTEKKITVSLEDYRMAVDAVIKQMTLTMESEFSKKIVKGIASQVAWELWDRLRLTSDLGRLADDLAKVTDQLIEEREQR